MENYKKEEASENLKTAVETIKNTVLEKFDEVVIEKQKLPTILFSISQNKNDLKLKESKVYSKKGKIQMEAKFETQKQKVTRAMSPYLLAEDAKPTKFEGNFSLQCQVKLVQADEE